MKRRKRVLFLCIGNICRSPMAEAFARKYGSDAIVPASAGLAPGAKASEEIRSVLLEKNVELENHAPRRFRELDLRKFDLIVNMSGQPLNDELGIPVENWTVRDPYGGALEDYRRARDEIESAVMRLILRIRTGKFDSDPATQRK